MKKETQLIAMVLIGLFIGFIIGYGCGVSITLHWGVKVGFKLLEMSNVTIGLNESSVQKLIGRYYIKLEKALD